MAFESFHMKTRKLDQSKIKCLISLTKLFLTVAPIAPNIQMIPSLSAPIRR